MMLFKLCDRKTLLFIGLLYSSFVTAGESIAIPLNISTSQLEYYEKNNFKILGALQLKSNIDPENRLIELSGIAWDNDEQKLTILSDRGFIINTKPIFNKNKLINLEFLSLHQLENKKGKKLKGSSSDSEGLALINSKNNRFNDTELIISFERKPRIVRYTTEGKLITKETINNSLDDIKKYKGKNKALEAITLHDKFNIITGPERPLKNTGNRLSLHTLNSKQWAFKPNNENYGSLVGLTTLPNNKIIALERSFPGIFAGITNVIHLISLDEETIEQETLLKLQPSDGYFNENFEGISWHKKKRFFMISDDNDNPFQRTLLIYFEIPSLENSATE